MTVPAVKASYLILYHLILHLDLIRRLLYNVAIYAPDSLGPLFRALLIT